MTEPMVLKIARTSDVSSASGAIAKFLREQKHVIVQAIGNTPTVKAIKSIALATKYLKDEKQSVLTSVEFFHTQNDKKADSEVVGIRFILNVSEVWEAVPEHD